MPLVLTKTWFVSVNHGYSSTCSASGKTELPEKPVKGTVSLEISNVIPRLYQLFVATIILVIESFTNRVELSTKVLSVMK